MIEYAIVVFIGASQKFGVNTTEFQKTLNTLGYKDILYVADTSVTWYNKRGVYEKLHKQIQTYLNERPHKNVVFFGSSMGGFGSILYASVFNRCEKVIAFGPQIHIDTKLTSDWDTRWVPNVGHLKEFIYPTVSDKFRKDIPYHLIVGTEEPRDQKHFDYVPKKDNIHIHVIEGSDHNIPKFLKSRNQLTQYIRKLL
jgi:hypothetical protein